MWASCKAWSFLRFCQFLFSLSYLEVLELVVILLLNRRLFLVVLMLGAIVLFDHGLIVVVFIKISIVLFGRSTLLGKEWNGI